MTNTATGQNLAVRTFTVPYAGGSGFAPSLVREPVSGDTTPPPDPGTEVPPQPYDPGAHTVAEVEAYVADHPDELDAITAAEEAGKARVTLLNALYSLQPA